MARLPAITSKLPGFLTSSPTNSRPEAAFLALQPPVALGGTDAVGVGVLQLAADAVERGEREPRREVGPRLHTIVPADLRVEGERRVCLVDQGKLQRGMMREIRGSVPFDHADLRGGVGEGEPHAAPR